jgi:hypothetical protein
MGGAYIYASHQGIALSPAAPDTITPASADLYIGLNRGGEQGTTLTALWDAYRTSAGTADALDHLRTQMNTRGTSPTKLATLLSTLGDQAALAMWVPSTPAAQPRVALMAQVRASDLLSGQNPLSGNATTAAAWSYGGTQVYTVTLTGSHTPALGCLVAGDGVLATDATTIKSVIDAANGTTPSLAANGDYKTTFSALPAAHIVSFYLSSRGSRLAQTSLNQAMAAAMALPAALHAPLLHLAVQPLALTVAAAQNGFSLATSALPFTTTVSALTPNQGADVVGKNAVLYTSESDLAAALQPVLQLAPRHDLTRLQQQVGIDLQRDVLSWMNGEFALSLSDSNSPLTGRLLPGGAGQTSASTGPTSGSAQPTRPGSLTLAWHIDHPSAVAAALQRLTAALTRSAGKSLSFQPATLSDGRIGYTAAGLAGLGYVIRGQWLILSSNLTGDGGAPSATLSSDDDYKSALSGAAMDNAATGVSYVNLSRLLGLVDGWKAVLMSGVGATPGGPRADTDWQRAEALVRPLHSVMLVTHRHANNEIALTAFLSLQHS